MLVGQKIAELFILNDCSSTFSINSFDIENIEVYPNPSTDFISIRNSNVDITHIEVFNTLGQLEFSNANNLTTIDIRNLEKGIYFLTLYSPASSKTVKIIKQ